MAKKQAITETQDTAAPAVGVVFQVKGIAGYQVTLANGETVSCDRFGNRINIRLGNESGTRAQQSAQRVLRALGRLRVGLHLQGYDTASVDVAITQEMAAVTATRIRIYSDVRDNAVGQLPAVKNADAGYKMVQSVLKEFPELGKLAK